MAFIFKPAIALINRLNFPTKFLLLIAIVFFMIIALAYQLTTPILTSKRISESELVGIRFNNGLYKVLDKLIDFHDVNTMNLSEADFKEQRTSEIKEIETAVHKMDDLAHKIGPQLDTLEAWEKIRSNWEKVKKDPNEYFSIMSQIGTLITRTCDNSNLTVELDIDISYLGDAYCTKLFDYVNAINLIRDIEHYALSNQTLTEKKRDSIIFYKNTMSIFMDSINNNIKTAFFSNPSLTPALRDLTKNLYDTTAEKRSLLEKGILAHHLDSNPIQNYESYSQLLTTVYSYREVLTDEIATLIKNRLKRLNRIIMLNVGTILLGLLLFSYIFFGIYFSILRSVQQLVRGTNEISKGNLHATVQLETKDELSIVGQSFNLMRENLEKLVTNIKKATHSIQQSSEEINLGNTNLSKRTIQQAASLEETSSSMDRIAETVKKNADIAKDSYSHAEGATEIATKGVQVINKMVHMMNSLNSSAHQITEIIEVINDVAFQTNILALNAAVEAARAGEQGRGFAVVATEIRNLSKRSSDSAHGIKSLINNSVEKVKDGTVLAEQALSTIEKITKSIHHVTKLMSDIANASGESNTSIQQINIAISEIDKVTQQNATLVEEATHSSRNLQDEINQMNSLVNVFQIGNIKVESNGRDILPKTQNPSSLYSKPSQQPSSEDEWKEF